MTIQEQLTQDMKQAMRERKENPQRLAVTRMIVDRIQKKEKETQAQLTQDETIQILQTFKKQINEEIDGFQKVGNDKQVEKLLEDLGIVDFYLPQQMSKEEVRTEIKAVLAQMSSGIFNKGAIMKEVVPALKGKADNKMISEVVNEVIEQQNK